MKTKKAIYSPAFRKTLLASLLVPLLSPLYSWAATVSVTDGSSLSINGLYDSAVDREYAVTVTGAGSEITGESDVIIKTTGTSGHGVYVANGGTLNLNGATIKTEGSSGNSIYNNGGTVNIKNGTMTTDNRSAHGISSTGVGSHTDIDGAVISTSGALAYGIYARGGTELTLNNTTINSSGNASYGIYLDNAGTTLVGANNTINNTNALNGTGIHLSSSGISAILDDTTIKMSNGGNGVNVVQGSSITMNGLIAAGNMTNLLSISGNATVNDADVRLTSGRLLLAQGANATNQAVVLLNNIHAISTGGDFTLVDVNQNANVTINEGSYHTQGNDAKGIWIRDSASSLTAKDTVIITEGSNATAIENRGTAVVDNTRVITKGDNSHGLYSQRSFDATNMAISTAGIGSIGAAAAVGGNLNLDNASIETTGNSGMVLGTFSGSSINAKNIIGTSTGNSAYALWTDVGSAILLEDSQITTQGLNAGGIYASNSGGSATQQYTQVTLNNAQIISEQGPGIYAYGANINVDVKNGSQLSAGNDVLAFAASNAGVISNVNVNGDNQAVLVGDIQAAENNNVSLTLSNNSIWTGAASNAKHVDIDSSSVWNLTGDADVESMHVLGQMNFAPRSNNSMARAAGYSFSTLTINNNLTGNGILTFNTELGDDNSATDRLYVVGNASGDHIVNVINQGGLGALTTGNGINLITVDGDTHASTFTMNHPVSAGAYEYFLYQIDDHSWNLQSSYAFTEIEPPFPPAPPPVDPGVEPGVEVEVEPGVEVEVEPGPGPGPSVDVAYRPEVPGYVGAPWLNAFYGFTTLGSLHERRGSAEGAAQGFSQDSWGRVRGQHNNFEAGRFAYDSNLWFIQMGHDFYQAENAVGKHTTAGLMVTLGQQNTNTQDRARGARSDLSINTGKIKTEAYSLGGYYTQMAQDGGYLDLVSQATLYRNRYESQQFAQHNGYGVVMSAEVGQPYPLIGNWVIEPQGQLKYQYLHLSARNFKDQVSEMSGTDYSVGQARAGFRLFSDAAKQQDIKPYLTTDVIHQMGRNPEVTVATVSIRPEFTKTYWQGGAGLTAKVSNNVDVYADAKYQRSFDGKMDGYLGNLGVKVSF